MGTLKRRIDSDEDLQNPGVVKVDDRPGRLCLYFSRAPIPLVRDDPKRSAVPGDYISFIGSDIYTRSPRAPDGFTDRDLEDAENWQLRASGERNRIRVWETPWRRCASIAPRTYRCLLANRAPDERFGKHQP